MAETMSLDEAAELLDVHYQTAYRWVRTGRLPAVKIDGQYAIERTALDDLTRQREAPEAPPAPSDLRLASRAEAMHAALVDGDEPAALDIARRLRADGASVVDLIERVLAPPLAAIGAAWHDGKLDIFVEHRATAIVERLLADLTPNPVGRRRGRAVVAALSGDRHGLPTLMATAALREDMWHVHHLGADIPASEIETFVQTEDVDVVVLSAATKQSRTKAARAAERLETLGLRVLVGGPGKSLGDLLDAAR